MRVELGAVPEYSGEGVGIGEEGTGEGTGLGDGRGILLLEVALHTVRVQLVIVELVMRVELLVLFRDMVELLRVELLNVLLDGVAVEYEITPTDGTTDLMNER